MSSFYIEENEHQPRVLPPIGKILSPIDERLLWSAMCGDVNAVKACLDQGADINTCTYLGATALSIASQSGSEMMVHLLLGYPKVDVNIRDIENNSPLQLAVKGAQLPTVSLLLHHGADVNVRDVMGRTPLHNSVSMKQYEIAKVLIQHGAKVNAADIFGFQPLHAALVQTTSPGMARLLLQNGAHPNSRNITGLGYINEVSLFSPDELKVPMVYMLVKQGASVNITDSIGKRTPLHVAAFMNNAELAEYLISAGADVNAQTRDGRTPLAVALCFRNWEVADVIERHAVPRNSSMDDSDEDTDDGQGSSVKMYKRKCSKCCGMI